MSAFGLQFGHGLGLALHERPIISRVVSLDHPTEIKEGMVFALETYCPASDGFSAARIEEEVVHPAGRAGVPGPAAAPDMGRRVDVGGDDIGLDLVAMHVGPRARVVDRG
jgi:hypothetical protein